MDDEKRFIEGHFIIEKGTGNDWEEGEIYNFLDEFLEWIESKNMYCGGSLGRMKDEEEECNYCEGSGRKDFISEEERCETCGGSGRKDEEEPEPDPEAVGDWNEIYAPIAQSGSEQPSPKGQVEGSNPSRSANVWNGCDREGTGEAERQDSSGNDRGDRARCEDPGRNHSGKA